ncbi:uncharacterized protein LOC107035714 [Diachasma alloeum]|uniref:uncharacterized protein LOC107035714 n=1 Tax=Diachasma alloeum TaxID=454923 RepID=UPI0007383A2C|nr:uncharacterized protein LOC107035714 [Diachasma alloeum]
MENTDCEKPKLKKRKRAAPVAPKLQVTECVREFKLPQTYPSMANAMKKSSMNVTLERIRGTQSTINLKIKSGKIDPTNKLQKLKLKSPDGRDLGEFDVQVLPHITGDNTLSMLKSISPEASKIPQLKVPGGMKPAPTISTIKYLQKPTQEARPSDQSATHGVLIPISPVVVNGQNYGVQNGTCQQMNVGNNGAVDASNVPLNFNKMQSMGNVSIKNTRTLPPGMKIKVVNGLSSQKLIGGKRVVSKDRIIGSKRKSLETPVARIDPSKIIKLDSLETVNVENDMYYVVPDEETLKVLPGVELPTQETLENVRQAPRSSLGRVNLLRREKKEPNASSGSTRSECDSTNIPVVQQGGSDFGGDGNGESTEVDGNDLSVLGEALRSLPDAELRNKALEALRSVGIGVERLIPKKAVEQISVKDSETQTEVFCMLDKGKEEFVRACEDEEGLERIPLRERQVEAAEGEGRREDTPQERWRCAFDGRELDSMLMKLAEGDRVKEVHNIMKYDPGTEKLYTQLQRDFANVRKFDENGFLNIHRAVLDEDVVGLRKQLMLLKACKISVDIPTQEGQTSLELAIKFVNSEEIIRLLLRAGANPTSSQTAHDSALTMASREGMRCLPLLIKHAPTPGALNYVDSSGFAAIHHCSQLGNYDGVMALIAADADLNVRDGKSGRTALFHALENDELRIARELLTSGAKPNLPNFAGQTCYHLIDETKHVSLKDFLTKTTK